MRAMISLPLRDKAEERKQHAKTLEERKAWGRAANLLCLAKDKPGYDRAAMAAVRAAEKFEEGQ